MSRLTSAGPARGLRLRVPRPLRFTDDSLWGHRDFVRLWSGRAVSQVGTEMSLVAIPLYAAIALDASPAQMGLVAASGGIPRLLLGFVAGALVDRMRRRPLMIAAEVGRGFAIATIPIAALLGMQSIALLIAVGLLSGVLAVFFGAAWAPYLPGLIGRGNLASANSRIRGSAAVAQVTGPSLAGSLVTTIGAPVVFAIDAITYLFSALRLARIRHVEADPVPPPPGSTLGREIREGIRVLVSSPVLRALTGSEATIQLGGWVFLAVYPLFMLDALGLSATGIGLVYTAGGIGGVLGSLVTTTAIRRFGVGGTIIWSALLFGVFGLTVPMAVLWPEYALELVVFAEFAQWMMLVVYNIAGGSLQQALTPDHLLGRVVASDQVLSAGVQPVAALLGGMLGSLIGVQTTLLLGVAGMFCAGIWVARSPIRHIRHMPTESDASLARPTATSQVPHTA